MWAHRLPLPSTVVLAIVALGLAIRAVSYDPEIIAAPATANTSSAVSEARERNTPERIDLNNYQETLARPLFVAERQPLLVASPGTSVSSETTVKQPLSADHIRLTGIMIGIHSSSVHLNANGSSAWIEVEGSFDGWEVITIDDNSATLQRDGQKIKKFLYAPE